MAFTNILVLAAPPLLFDSEDFTYSGGIWAGTGSGPVSVALTGTRPIPGQERVFKIAKRTVENRYSLKSENVEYHFS